MQAHWKQTSANCQQYIDVNQPHKLYGKVIEENGVFTAWYLNKEGDLKKCKDALPNFAAGQIVVEGMLQNPNVAKL